MPITEKKGLIEKPIDSSVKCSEESKREAPLDSISNFSKSAGVRGVQGMHAKRVTGTPKRLSIAYTEYKTNITV